MRRIPFDQRLWRPEQYLGPHAEEDRDRMRLAILTRREGDQPPPDYSAEEFRPGYMAKLRRKIEGRGEEPIRAVVRLDRAVGDRR